MKHRLGAAIAAVALILAPAAVMASNSNWAVVTGWDPDNHIVSGLEQSWSTVELLHGPGTIHRAFQGEIHQLAPPCRGIANRWTTFVALEADHPNHDYTPRFEKLLAKMAEKQCKIAFTTNGGGGGVNNLASVGPSQ